jgi:hypothetical protein
MDISILPLTIFYHSVKPGTPVKYNEGVDMAEKKQIVMRRRRRKICTENGKESRPWKSVSTH